MTNLASHASLGDRGKGGRRGHSFPFKAPFRSGTRTAAHVHSSCKGYWEVYLLGEVKCPAKMGILLLKEEGGMDIAGQLLLLYVSPPQLRFLERTLAVSITQRPLEKVPRCAQSVCPRTGGLVSSLARLN